jgi:inhibitor of KinA sporulation pathway (predicted exonuclease)
MFERAEISKFTGSICGKLTHRKRLAHRVKKEKEDKIMVRRRFDLLLIVDIEATCWQAGTEPEDEQSEIIEIGLCTLDIASGERLTRRSILVRPERSRVSAFCTELTTLTQEQVDQGVSFARACEILREEYASHERVWASYGDYDRTMFLEECQQRQILYPFGTRHLNIKTLFPLFCGYHQEVGMARALQLLGLPLEGTHHRGDDDAWNIAAILSTMLRRSRPPLQEQQALDPQNIPDQHASSTPFSSEA